MRMHGACVPRAYKQQCNVSDSKIADTITQPAGLQCGMLCACMQAGRQAGRQAVSAQRVRPKQLLKAL